MIMEPYPPGKVPPGGTTTDRALPQPHFTKDPIEDSNKQSSEIGLPSKRSIKRNKTGYSQGISNHAVAEPPFVLPNNQKENQGQGTVPSSHSDIENGISRESSSPSNKKEGHGITVERISPSYRSATPSPIFAGAPVKQERPNSERSNQSYNILSKRHSSSLSRYHDNCTPKIDPTLIIGNPSRTPSPRPRIKRPSSLKRPNSELCLLSRRESITNLIFSGPSVIDQSEDTSGWETVYKKRLSFGTFSCSSSLFSRMASPLRDPNVTPAEFDVMEDLDYSSSRPSSLSKQQQFQSSRPGFLYQAVSFDHLAKDVPNFVKSYAQKNGKMLTESFILRVNYLRRRRQLGEMTNTINIGHNMKRPATGGDRMSGSPR